MSLFSKRRTLRLKRCYNIKMLSFILYLILIIFTLFSLGAFWRAPWFPTKKDDYDIIAKLAQLKENINFYDLGSGTGEMLFYFSKKYGANCVGIEISPILYLYSKIKSFFKKRVKIFYGNFFLYNLSEADVVFIFAHPKLNEKLRKKLTEELKNEAKIIVACWPFENTKPLSVAKGKSKINYYLYRKTSLIK
jgi:SAM-dependent methyltransferase